MNISNPSDKRIRSFFEEEKVSRRNRLRVLNGQISATQLVVTYDTQERSVRCIDLEEFEKLDYETDLITGQISRSLSFGYGHHVFGDSGLLGKSPDEGPDRFFSVVATSKNITIFERWLRRQRDYQSAAQIRTLFEGVEFTPPSVPERVTEWWTKFLSA